MTAMIGSFLWPGTVRVRDSFMSAMFWSHLSPCDRCSDIVIDVLSCK